jgi:hypothetical protein
VSLTFERLCHVRSAHFFSQRFPSIQTGHMQVQICNRSLYDLSVG